MADRSFEVRFLQSAKRDLAAQPVAAQRRLARTIDRLALDPRPRAARLLAGRAGERICRLRIGVYRILYEVRDGELVVLVIRVGHRRDVHRGR